MPALGSTPRTWLVAASLQILLLPHVSPASVAKGFSNTPCLQMTAVKKQTPTCRRARAVSFHSLHSMGEAKPDTVSI